MRITLAPIIGGYRRLPGGSDDFSLQTNRQTLRHNIYIIQQWMFWRDYLFAIKKLRHFFTKTFIPGFYTEHHGDSGFHLRMPSKRIFACMRVGFLLRMPNKKRILFENA